MDLARKNALVTGGAVRLGRSLVTFLAEEGCGVAVHHHSSASEAEALVSELRSQGRDAVSLQGDLADPRVPEILVREAIRALGSLEILVNSAAVFPDRGLAETDAESWDAQMAVNLRAPFLLSRAFAETLGGARGSILNLTDNRVHRPAGDHFAYRLSKVGLSEMTRMLAAELAPGATVNAVALGAILPPPGESRSDFEARVRDSVPLGRAGGPGALVAAARYLLTSDFVTGAVLPVDGGEYL
ncbi:MAG: SDR family oxidoreductase [Thermoanaerobaculia bacterium]|nr:SDR family oxidoreductase [Thermoanaerobaculia bacterium]